MPTISELQQMETAVLIDMLASHTADYTRMLTEGHNTEEEYARYNLTIKAIQAEIELRKKTADVTITESILRSPPDYI